MAAGVTPEEELGLQPGASSDAFRQAFRRLVREHHPDHHAEATEAERRHHALELERVMRAWERWQASELPAQASDAVEEDDLEELDDLTDRFEPETGEPIVDAPRPWAIFLPVALFALAVVTFSVSVVMSLRVLWQAAAVLLVLAGVSFVLVPFFAMLRPRR